MAKDKLTEALAWAMKALNQTKMNTTVVVETPWSNVLKIITLQGPVYLKQTPPDLFIEVDIIQKCRELCEITDIPEVIAVNKNLHCFFLSIFQNYTKISSARLISWHFTNNII